MKLTFKHVQHDQSTHGRRGGLGKSIELDIRGKLRTGTDYEEVPKMITRRVGNDLVNMPNNKTSKGHEYSDTVFRLKPSGITKVTKLLTSMGFTQQANEARQIIFSHADGTSVVMDRMVAGTRDTYVK